MEEEKIKPKLRMIVAVNEFGFIGLDGGMPWRCREDLKHFKRLTLGHKCVVGRKTFEGLPPLKDRELIVIGRDRVSPEMAMDILEDGDWIIGGNQIYEMFFPYCNEIHVSVINDYSTGDVALFENIADDWKQLLATWLYSGNNSLHIHHFEADVAK